MRVAYYSPLPPESSGIADYSALLLPALRERLDVETVKRGRTKPSRGSDSSWWNHSRMEFVTPCESTMVEPGLAFAAMTAERREEQWGPPIISVQLFTESFVPVTM